MSVLAVVSVPASAFVLGTTFAVDPAVHVRLERFVPVGDDTVPYFWIGDDSVERVTTALEADPEVEAWAVVEQTGSEALVRVEWANNAEPLLDAIREHDGHILEATGSAETWELRIRFVDHEHLAACYRTCADRDIPLTLERLHNPGVPEEMGIWSSVTDTQRRTILAAFEAGYFDVPRQTSLVELAEDLGVSDTAVSQRLRRGLTSLIAATLVEN
jgi:predicted DNA binding protein